MPKALENRGKIRKAPRPSGTATRRRMAEAADLHLMDFEQRSVPLVFQENRRARRIILWSGAGFLLALLALIATAVYCLGFVWLLRRNLKVVEVVK